MLLVEDSNVSLRQISADEILLQFEAGLVSSAGAVFAVQTDDRVTLHDFETGAELNRWLIDWEDVQQMHMSPDGEPLLVHADGELWLLRADSETPAPLSAGRAGVPAAVIFAAGGAHFATLHAEHVLLWDATSGTALGAYPLGDTPADKLELAFSADGETLYAFVRLADGLAGLTAVDIADNAVQRRTYLNVSYGELSPEGEFLLLALRTGELQIAGASTGEILHSLPMDYSPIQSLRPAAPAGLAAGVLGKRCHGLGYRRRSH